MVLTIFYCYPYLGRWSNLTSIFQVAWNHHLVVMLWCNLNSITGRTVQKHNRSWTFFPWKWMVELKDDPFLLRFGNEFQGICLSNFRSIDSFFFGGKICWGVSRFFALPSPSVSWLGRCLQESGRWQLRTWFQRVCSKRLGQRTMPWWFRSFSGMYSKLQWFSAAWLGLYSWFQKVKVRPSFSIWWV